MDQQELERPPGLAPWVGTCTSTDCSISTSGIPKRNMSSLMTSTGNGSPLKNNCSVANGNSNSLTSTEKKRYKSILNKTVQFGLPAILLCNQDIFNVIAESPEYPWLQGNMIMHPVSHPFFGPPRVSHILSVDNEILDEEDDVNTQISWSQSQ